MGRPKADEPPHIYQSTLLSDRGWTASMVRRHLGEPDKLAVNQHYRSGPMAKLYRLDRVEKAEKTPEFQAAMVRLRARRDKAETKAFFEDLGDLRDALGHLGADEVLDPGQVWLASSVLRRWAEHPELAESREGQEEHAGITVQVERARTRARAERSAWLNAQEVRVEVPRRALPAGKEDDGRYFTINSLRHEHTNYEEVLRRLPPPYRDLYPKIKETVNLLVRQAIGRLRAQPHLDCTVVQGRLGDYDGWTPSPIEANSSEDLGSERSPT